MTNQQRFHIVDGMPCRLVLNAYTLHCQHGTDYHKGSKKKYQQAQEVSLVDLICLCSV